MIPAHLRMELEGGEWSLLLSSGGILGAAPSEPHHVTAEDGTRVRVDKGAQKVAALYEIAQKKNGCTHEVAVWEKGAKPRPCPYLRLPGSDRCALHAAGRFPAPNHA